MSSKFDDSAVRGSNKPAESESGEALDTGVVDSTESRETEPTDIKRSWPLNSKDY